MSLEQPRKTLWRRWHMYRECTFLLARLMGSPFDFSPGSLMQITGWDYRIWLFVGDARKTKKLVCPYTLKNLSKAIELSLVQQGPPATWKVVRWGEEEISMHLGKYAWVGRIMTFLFLRERWGFMIPIAFVKHVISMRMASWVGSGRKAVEIEIATPQWRWCPLPALFHGTKVAGSKDWPLEGFIWQKGPGNNVFTVLVCYHHREDH